MISRTEFGWVVWTCSLFCLALPIWGQESDWDAGIAKVITHGTKAPATAFVVAVKDQSAWLVTSAHVVQGDAEPDIEFRASPISLKHASVRDPQFDSSYGLRGLAILVVPDPPAGVRALAAGRDAQRLDQVVVVGYPASNNGTFTAATSDVGSADSAEIVVNTYTDDGYSGGPVLRGGAVSGMVFGQRPGKGVALTVETIRSYLKGKITWGDAPVVGRQQSKSPTGTQGEIRVNPLDGLKYVWVDPGTFLMGCADNYFPEVKYLDRGAFRDSCDQVYGDSPQHSVKLTKGFWIGQSEVTQGAFQRLMGNNPSVNPHQAGGAERAGFKLPVTNVQWIDARDYCSAVGGRLPFEAEWEYAARGGTSASRYSDLDQIAWFDWNSNHEFHEVQSKPKGQNDFGLFDMLGNAAEWVWDRYDLNYYKTSSNWIDPHGPETGYERVLRGGSVYSLPSEVTSYSRNGESTTSYYLGDSGFRCVLDSIQSPGNSTVSTGTVPNP